MIIIISDVSKTRWETGSQLVGVLCSLKISEMFDNQWYSGYGKGEEKSRGK